MFPQDRNIALNTFLGFNNLLYSEFFQVYVAKNTPANHRPLAMILTPVDQRLQSDIHTLL